MKNKGLVATIVIMSGIIVMLLVTLLLIKMPSIVGIKSIIIDAREKTETIESSVEESIEETQEIIPEKKVETKILNYSGYNDYVNIEYPEINGMDDEDLQERLNFKIKTNALSIVGLYPISTALQKLDIYCEVKDLNDDYITILYSGKVVGRGVKSSGGSSSGSSSGGKSSTSGKDPYLNGFVDPLGLGAINYQQPNTNINSGANASGGLAGIMNNATTQAAVSNAGSLPAPNQDSSTKIYRTDEVAISAANAQASNVKNGNAGDGGPTVYNEPAPTAAKASPRKALQSAASQILDGNYATNNPTSNVINSTATENNPLIPNSQAPAAQYGQNNPGANVVQNTPPVVGYAGTNTSASTIDQNIFYTNTINLKTCEDVKLTDFADAAELAKFARSSDVEFVNIESQNRTAVRNYIKKTVLSKLTDDLSSAADFRNTELKVWPKHFSYRDADGTIYFTIKLSSKLGNYAIIKYKK